MNMTHPDILTAERTGYGPNNQPDDEARCEVCRDEVYRYEVSQCGLCDRVDVCVHCFSRCSWCDKTGCSKCIKPVVTGEFIEDICPDCREKHNSNRKDSE